MGNLLFRTALSAALLIGPVAHAQGASLTYNVNTTADLPDDGLGVTACHTSAGNCSLRAAIMKANQVTVAEVVIRLPAGIYRITRQGGGEANGDLNLEPTLSSGPSVTIEGSGAANTIIDANHLSRALQIGPSRTATIGSLTIRNGEADDGAGGAIKLDRATLVITDCIIENNHASNAGGAIEMSESVLSVARSTIRSNSAGFNGGGIILGGEATIRDSTFHANGADQGGAVANFGQTIIVNSTVSRNYANSSGGGIYNANKTFLYNSTVVENDADHDHDQNGGTGGGIYAQAGSRAVIVNTLIASNTQLDGNSSDDCNGTLEAYGWNLLSDLTGCAFTGNGNLGRGLVSANSIGALQDNGGPTLTHALLPVSQAVNATNNQGCVDQAGAQLITDQRGAPRGSGLDCDVGAFELGDGIFKNGFE
jgi:hypothetical protein